ncbi:hypothetical protein M8845_16975 [Gelidibacter japonicus]|uniref:hypothetical protein n=1 Tax=Gelidibacter japonicus TaxID=1962232 RepID=UPI00202167E1|nr:hypothetical protein [Gelidibacter japonicus]MCL8009125.1 hypothetical protein [Gelidibacter japonicus]
MAEIKIDRKKPVWPWILLILVVLGIIAYLVYDSPERDDHIDDIDDDVTNEHVIDSDGGQSGTTGAYSAGTAYDQYTAFEGSIRDSTRIAIDSSYTKKAYYNLSKAVAKKADEHNVEESQALIDLRNFSMLITKVSSPLSSAESAKNFKTASDKVAKVLEDIQIKSYPELQSQIADLKQVTSEMDGYISMDKQQDNITQFLQKSRDVLKAMNK